LVAMPVVEVTDDNFRELITSNRVVVIDFWARWCAPCKVMEPIFSALSEKYAGSAVFGKVNTDVYPEIAASLDVYAVPTFVVLVNGRVYGRVTGVVSAARLEEVVKEAIRAAEHEIARE